MRDGYNALWYCCKCSVVIHRPWTIPMMRVASEGGFHYRGRCPVCDEDHDFFPVRDQNENPI